MLQNAERRPLESLSNPPLCFRAWQRRMLLAIARLGRSLKRLHRPNLLAYGYMGFKDRTKIQKAYGVQPCLPQCRPYEASEGIYPVTGKEKTGGGQALIDLFHRHVRR